MAITAPASALNFTPNSTSIPSGSRTSARNVFKADGSVTHILQRVLELALDIMDGLPGTT